MKQLSPLDKHMLRDMMATSDKLIVELLKELEALELVKDIPSLKKMRVAQKKILSKTVIKFLV